MLRTLLESRPTRRRRRGGMVVSALVHAGIIGLAATATAREVVRPADDPSRARPVVFLAAAVPAPAQPRGLSAGSPHHATTATSVPDVPQVAVPTDIPVGIPDVLDPLRTPLDAVTIGASAFAGSGSRVASPGAGGEGASAGDGRWTSAEAVLRLVRQPQEPHYPDILRQAGVEGRVTLRFVVDSTGRVDRASVEVLESAHALFATSATRALLGYRFEPAQSSGRLVPATAIMSFEFRIRR